MVVTEAARTALEGLVSVTVNVSSGSPTWPQIVSVIDCGPSPGWNVSVPLWDTKSAPAPQLAAPVAVTGAVANWTATTSPLAGETETWSVAVTVPVAPRTTVRVDGVRLIVGAPSSLA